ncbi:ABC transporter permease [Micromonospora echinospora]|uniref:ABC-type transport system involved in multi-copper enzyme maturation, permease component n=1 Tax=Micromonospora echinospora TaxID=1877 RepID=A0A1C4WXE1_MICEC|nr:ABC transporter permease subunit [Micromonospora echinospora]OZV79776.1 ABC transporter permease [Micromonospora echinospora]SCF00541.1 ABC-type transport system involved in multi-copper enzyme maturation, permease component [Micromonospora echinospora]
MSLYVTELRRLGKRRFTRYMTLIGLLVLLAVAVGTFLTNQKIGPEQRAAAERAAQAQYERQVRFMEQDRAECERLQAAGEPTGDRYPDDCSAITPPAREDFEARWFLPSTFDFRESFGATLIPYAAILALVAFVVGASFVGAEWSTGGMMNLLLWRPKRLNVLLTKLAALLTGVVAVTVLGLLAWTAAFWAVGSFRGSTARMTSGVWQSFALTGLRGFALVVVAAVVGFALASLGRHTAFALGGVLAVAVVGQFGLGVVLALADVKFPEAWLIPTYGLAWMGKEIKLQNYDACNFSVSGGCEPDVLTITWQHSSVLLLTGLVLALGAALWSMRRRDIA